MTNTTLCYIERDGCYLMLHRVKKKHDLNHDKWVGIGGKFEPGETPEACLLREAREETGLVLTDYRLCGLVTFLSDEWGGEYMYLYHATGFTGTLRDCDEGTLEWVPIEQVAALPQWEGDRFFFEQMRKNAPYFTMLLRYEGDRLAEARLNETVDLLRRS